MFLGESPSKKSVARLRQKVGDLLQSGNMMPWAEVRNRLNATLRGWSSYFCLGDRYPAYRAVNHYVYQRVGALSAALSSLRQMRGLRVGPVVVDAVGIGYHVATHLSDQGFEVYGFNAGASPVNAELFVNAKAEAYWSLREWLERGGIAGLTDEEMQAQLAGVRYRHSPAGRVEIESKDDAKKRGQSSPDRAEALVLACVRVIPREQTVSFGGTYSISPI